MVSFSRVTGSILKKAYTKRKTGSHKFDFGSLVVIGGSKLYHGSPAFNAAAAYRTGVDIVTILAPERAANLVASYSPDMITYPLYGDFISMSHLKIMKDFASTASCVVIGGGAGRNPETIRTINNFMSEMKNVKKPCVVDADAIRAFSEKKSKLGNNFIMTPHADEFFALSGIKVSGKGISEKAEAAAKVASDTGSVIILKGNTDIITDGCSTMLNRTGNPFMTVGGTGDTLAGICGSLLAQGVDSFTSACAACYINGKAGDIAAKSMKQAMTATDLVNSISSVF